MCLFCLLLPGSRCLAEGLDLSICKIVVLINIPFQRLQFFGLLMRLRKLHTIELEVSHWDPPPSPQGMRALANELRLYCPTVMCVVFVEDFERTVIRVMNGFCAVDYDTNTDNLWRDEG